MVFPQKQKKKIQSGVIVFIKRIILAPQEQLDFSID